MLGLAYRMLELRQIITNRHDSIMHLSLSRQYLQIEKDRLDIIIITTHITRIN